MSVIVTICAEERSFHVLFSPVFSKNKSEKGGPLPGLIACARRPLLGRTFFKMKVEHFTILMIPIFDNFDTWMYLFLLFF